MRIYSGILFLFLISCTNSNEKDNFLLQKGDILFQDLDSSPLCEAIERVTPGYKKANFSHIGIVLELGDPFCINSDYLYEDNIRILEAIPNKVTTTRLDSFLNRSFDKNNNPKVIVGRLKKEYQYTIDDAIEFLKSTIGTAYDNAFIINNNSYYCSELIYEAFEKDSIFRLQPMTFLDPISKDTLQIWKEYYLKLKIDIPQYEPGINPGIMSISNKIDIIHEYGLPSNYIKQ
ncbi:MAG: YiiX/YebB-like N1pC/P60 family cysteine hydrolase [Flavobacteriales bacterium]|jgi:hypothetical protein|tara:strand:+ start:280 stop:975 length:696 start_codon:yes stop_codon:yes gene_type:complete